MIQMMTGHVTGEELEFMNPSFGDYNKDLPGPGIKKNGKNTSIRNMYFEELLC